MINVTLSFSFLYLKFFFENKTLALRLKIKDKELIDYEREFKKSFKCAICSQRVEFEDSAMRLCDECLDEYMKFWKKKLR